MGESVLRFPIKCPMCGRRLSDDAQSEYELQRHRTAWRPRDLRVPGHGIRMNGFAPHSAQLKTPTAPVEDRCAASAPGVGRVLRNRYILESRLDSGGVGTVFKALDLYRRDLPEENRHIAIKLLDETTDSSPDILSKLRHEFFCAQVLSHRSIVKAYELDRDNDIAFFTMELLEGEVLSSALERSPPISISRPSAWAIILEIGDGLAHAHARNVVHGDLKPQNIMITNSGELRILHFGASHSVAHDRSRVLTPAYASCELLEGQQADPRDDVYALACISYELLAGEHPFQHRKSIEARDLGLTARRPRGLTRRQWQTLAMGLSWKREDRSIPVHEWIVRLIPGQATARRLTQFLARYTGRSVRLTLPSARAIALLGILCVGLTICGSIDRVSLGGKTTGQTTPPLSAANTLIDADPMTRDPYSLQNGISSAEPAIRPAQESEKSTYPAATLAAAAVSDAERAKSHNGKSRRVSIAADTYRIPSREHFAEIHVRRSAGFGGDTAFVWWTEPSSARPGVDYVPQGRMTRFLPKGKHSASLFIRIIPNASRKRTATFYVNIGDPRTGSPVRYIERTAILLPPSI